MRSPFLTTYPPLVVIGASTGGPKAIMTILSDLPRTLPVPVVVIQHVEREFSAGLAEWLDNHTPLTVILAAEGVRPEPGKVYVAGGPFHLTLTKAFRFSYVRGPDELPYHPSVDLFFKSIPNHRGHPKADGSSLRSVAVLLTGMGKDGASGLLALRLSGWHTIAQDQATSVVYGMPRAAKELGAADEILPVSMIASAILKGIGAVS